MSDKNESVIVAGSIYEFRSDLIVGEPSNDERVVIFDPTNNRVYRVSAVTLHALRIFDGKRETQAVCEVLAGEGFIISLDTLTTMIERAKTTNFFVGEQVSPPAADIAHLRGPSRRNPLFFCIFEIDPRPMLYRVEPVFRRLFSPLGVTSFILLFIAAMMSIALNSEHYVASLYNFSNIFAWIITYVLVTILTCLHEIGHATAVMKYGGECRKMGLSLYLLSPAAYADTSDAYRFSRTREKVIVSLGGIYVETYVLTISIILWTLDIFPNLITAGLFIFAHYILARVIVNLNPFLRFDGYWILADLLHISNLRSKSFAYVIALISPFYTDRSMAHVATSRKERVFFFLYGLTAFIVATLSIISAFYLFNQFLGHNTSFPAAVIMTGLMFAMGSFVLYGGMKYVRSLRLGYGRSKRED